MLAKICLISCFIVIFPFFSQLSFAQTSPVLNEVMVHPTSGSPEWIEIANHEERDLHTYWIDDDTSFEEDGGGSTKKQLTTVTTAQYSIFDLPATMFNNDGDTLVLFDSSGNIVDQYTYTTDPGSNKTIGRYPDGQGELQVLEVATKGSNNSNPQLPPTATPTKLPTPTKQPTPTKSPTATKVPTTTRSPSLLPTKLPARSPTLMDKHSPVRKIATNEAVPTAILGVSSSAQPTEVTKKNKKVLVKEATSKNPVLFLPLIIGGLFLLACGILMYRRKMHQEV